MPKNNEEKSIFLRLETSLPSPPTGISQRFCVNRKLKARWHDDPADTLSAIAAEFNSYKGSVIGDMVGALDGLVKNEARKDPTADRRLDVARWTAALIETSLYDCLAAGDYDDSEELDRIATLDGDIKHMQPVSQSELADVDIEKLTLLLAPKLQHLCYLISKRMKKENDDNI